MNYELMNSDEVISELVSDKNGLTDNEVKKRLVMYGKNYFNFSFYLYIFIYD